MKIPGKGLLKTVSILFIVFGVIFTLSAIISLFSISKMNSPDFASSLPAGGNPGMFDTKTMLVSALHDWGDPVRAFGGFPVYRRHHHRL